MNQLPMDVLLASIASRDTEINQMHREIRELRSMVQRAHDRIDELEQTVDKARKAYQELKKARET